MLSVLTFRSVSLTNKPWACCQIAVVSGCERFIGMRYRLGADGRDGEIDCIHLTYQVLAELGVPTPQFEPDWYDSDARTILKAINSWGERIERPGYDGDVLLLSDSAVSWAFSVVWQNGILYINRDLNQVKWSPLHMLSSVRSYRCSRMKKS